MMQYINSPLNSQGTTHVSPLRMSHGVSVVRVLQWCNTLIRLWTHKGHPVYRACGWAMGCPLWGSCSGAIHYCDFELTRDTPCIALTDEPWGVCCGGPVIQYIIPTLNSLGTPHVSPLRITHGVSVVKFLWWCNTLLRLWTHKGHHTYRPYGWAMWCLLRGPCSYAIH